MQQIPDKEFILKLLQTYKGCRKINEDNKDYYKYKQDHITRYLSHQTTNNIHKIITVFMKYGQPDYKNMISNN